MPKKLLIANWKSNPTSLSKALLLAKQIDAKNVVIAPPFPFLIPLQLILKKSMLCAQDVFWKAQGPFTGEVGLDLLKKMKVKYVILGHSEQRKLGETDIQIEKKVEAVLGAGLHAVLCVGEPISIRKKGTRAVQVFLEKQLKNDLQKIPEILLKKGNLIIAYEPIWAISTSGFGKGDTPESAAEVISWIKRQLYFKFQITKPTVFYGGSVNEKNLDFFLKQNCIDGALVGGASLKATIFTKMTNIASKYTRI
jgi:triosephosphate isomerase (TIM)